MVTNFALGERGREGEEFEGEKGKGILELQIDDA